MNKIQRNVILNPDREWAWVWFKFYHTEGKFSLLASPHTVFISLGLLSHFISCPNAYKLLLLRPRSLKTMSENWHILQRRRPELVLHSIYEHLLLSTPSFNSFSHPCQEETHKERIKKASCFRGHFPKTDYEWTLVHEKQSSPALGFRSWLHSLDLLWWRDHLCWMVY